MEQPKIQPGLTGAGKVEQTAPSNSQDPARVAGPAFQVLLDRIQSQTKELKASSKTLDNPASLNEAVDIARASLDDALSLGDRLLEAFREAQQQIATPTSQSEQKN